MARTRRDRGKDRKSLNFWVLVAFLIAVFAMGGASRADVESLIILRPLAVVVCGFGAWRLTRPQIADSRPVFALFAALFALTIAHLVPLPPALWRLLPGHGIAAEVDAAAGMGALWRPISLVPAATWNALWSLFVPLAVLLLASGLRTGERSAVLPVLIAAGIVSGMIGLAQIAGPGGDQRYLYATTNEGAAVGLFANRNHAAVFLAAVFPMLAVFASSDPVTGERSPVRFWGAFAVGIVLLPLILITGSRAGVLLGALGLASIPLLYRRGVRTALAPRRSSYAIAVTATIALVLVMILFSEAEAVRRILAANQTSDVRFQLWRPIVHMIPTYLPLGSGVGSFVEVYALGEPYALLDDSYANHAHNDWLEVVLTAGIPGALLLLAVAGAAGWASLGAWRRRPRTARLDLARLGSVLLLMFALASVGDYPLRTPSLMCVFVVASLWLNAGRRTPVTANGMDDRAAAADRSSVYER